MCHSAKGRWDLRHRLPTELCSPAVLRNAGRPLCHRAVERPFFSTSCLCSFLVCFGMGQCCCGVRARAVKWSCGTSTPPTKRWFCLPDPQRCSGLRGGMQESHAHASPVCAMCFRPAFNLCTMSIVEWELELEESAQQHQAPLPREAAGPP